MVKSVPDFNEEKRLLHQTGPVMSPRKSTLSSSLHRDLNMSMDTSVNLKRPGCPSPSPIEPTQGPQGVSHPQNSATT